MAKPKPKGEKVSVHLSPELRGELDGRVLDERGPSATMAQTFARYAYLCRRTQHGMSDDEVAQFILALNGAALGVSQIVVLPGVLAYCAAENDVEFTNGTIAKLETLTLAQRIVLADDIERNSR